MKNFLLAIVFCALSGLFFPLSAQSKATIHLKTGEFIPGIIQSRNDASVQIKSADDGKNYSFDMTEVDYISQEDEPRKNYQESKFRGFIDMGYALGIGAPRNNAFEIETSFGYQFSHFLYVGAGLAVHFPHSILDSYPFRGDFYETKRNDPNWRNPFMPLYVNLRSNLYEEDRITPFADLKVGGTFINHTGFYLSPAVGVHFPTRSTFAFNVTLGYQLQTASYKQWCLGSVPGAIIDGSGGTYLNSKKGFSAITLKAGVEF